VSKPIKIDSCAVMTLTYLAAAVAGWVIVRKVTR
jgi:hypothetical protein